MALQFISSDNFPAYVALSSDITSGCPLAGASLIGKTVYAEDTGDWYIISGSGLILQKFYFPGVRP